MRIRALDHIVLTVSNPEATVAFYERLGMRREAFGEGRLALRFGDQKLNLHRAGAEHLQHREPGAGEADHEVRPAGQRRAGLHVTVC